MTQTYDIAIAGAGPAGLACALSLAKRGWRVAVIDPALARRWQHLPSMDAKSP
ncbi:FAD-dependent oxidoreductase [Asaia astilbis]|uniref:FAD-dependent oxidoreductase n=1 Tax=Asaia astilbis TaxID=610244 RepID=UPI00277D0E11|nr:FAD-dependent oxidoreductase [Asaia astilbis]